MAKAGEEPWTGAAPGHMVDVQRLREELAERPDLEVATWCGDREAVTVGCSLCGCCGACFLLPLVGIALVLGVGLSGVWAPLTGGICIALFLAGICLLCWFLAPLVASAVSPPPPGACVAPLVAPAHNPTHAKAEAMKRVAVVFNPHSGKGNAAQVLRRRVVPVFAARGIEVEEISTQRVGHARDIGLTTGLAGFDGVVVMGGDGTLHEVANGLLARVAAKPASEGLPAPHLPPLGLIPLGSGNAIAAHFRQNQARRGQEVSVHSELEAVSEWATRRVASGASCCVDVLEVSASGQRVACVALALFGLVGEVDVLAEPLRWMGPCRFDVAAIWGLLKSRPMDPCEISVVRPDGSQQVLTNVVERGGSPWLAFAVNLGQHWSDSLRVSPASQLDDGVVELHLIKCGVSRRELLRYFTLLGNGSYTKTPQAKHYVETIPCTDISIRFLPACPESASRGATGLVGAVESGALRHGVFNIDGEIFRHEGRVRLRVLPRHLRVFCDPAEECVGGDFGRAPGPEVHGTFEVQLRA